MATAFSCQVSPDRGWAAGAGQQRFWVTFLHRPAGLKQHLGTATPRLPVGKATQRGDCRLVFFPKSCVGGQRAGQSSGCVRWTEALRTREELGEAQEEAAHSEHGCDPNPEGRSEGEVKSSSFESRQLVNRLLFPLESQFPGCKVNIPHLSLKLGVKVPASGHSQAEGMRRPCREGSGH